MEDDPFKHRLVAMLSSVQNEFVVNMISVLNISALIVKDLIQSNSLDFIWYWMIVQLIINGLFFIGLAAKWYVYSFKGAYNSFQVWSETVAQIFNFIALS